LHPPLGGGLPPKPPAAAFSAAEPTERAANVSDREREKDKPAPSKWHRLKASLFGRKPDAPIGELTPAPETKADELTPPALPLAGTEAPPVTEPKAKPDTAKDTPAAAVISSPTSGLPAEKAAGSGKKKSKSGSQKRQRNRLFNVGMTEAEYAEAETRARAAGLSKAAYGRACILGNKGPRAKRAPPLNRVALGEAIAALNRVGNNLNQIAHHLNAGGHPDRAAIAQSNDKLDACLSAISKALGRKE